MDFRERKKIRTDWYFKYEYKKKSTTCTACNGSGYYDNTNRYGRTPRCSSCEGTGKDKDSTMAIYLLGYTIDNEVVLACNRDGSFMGGENITEVQKLLPDYNEYHRRDHTWSASAAIHWMQYQPNILRFNNLQEVDDNMNEDRKFHHAGSVAGHAYFCKFKAGYKPEIIQTAKLI